MPQAGGARFLAQESPYLDLGSLSDDEWLALLKECSSERGHASFRGHQIKTNELIGPLKNQAQLARKRFANLTTRMDADVLPIYFSTILEALVPYEDVGKDGLPVQRLDSTTLCEVISRLHTLPNHPCGRAICSVGYRIADANLPMETVGIIGHYAVQDPDPTPDDYKGNGKELVNHAINTVRGSGADTLAKVLFAQPTLAPFLTPFIEKLAHDPSPSVRAATVHPLLPLLNHERDTAVMLFLEICGSDPRIWTSHYIERFIFYATFTHYAAVQPLLRCMIGSDDEEARAIAARQICMAAFRHKEADPELRAVLTGDEVSRNAAAVIFGQNHHHPSVRADCEKHLLRLLNDESAVVRQAAESWLFKLEAAVATGDWQFFKQYLESKAFAEEPATCLRELQEISAVPPDVVLCLADRSIELSKRDPTAEPAKAYRFADHTPALVVRLYHQSEDESLRSRCLDLLDTMLALGWNQAAIEMANAER